MQTIEIASKARIIACLFLLERRVESSEADALCAWACRAEPDKDGDIGRCKGAFGSFQSQDQSKVHDIRFSREGLQVMLEGGEPAIDWEKDVIRQLSEEII